jgi:di/tripeptidase
MTTFAEDVAAMTEDLYAEFAEPITYTPADATPARTIKAIIDYGSGDEYKGADSYGIRATMRVQASELEQLARKDEFTIDGATWVVIGADLSADGLEWIISINKVS